ncbi:MAG: DUF3791 domain-containing protein [Treponema sp.]|jgi:hypothetical protein|nr:DUF3791 domain-containing protein [Treponema sp.]
MTEINEDILLFVIFCIESVAEAAGLKGNEVYKIMVEQTDILDDYIIPCYDALHTQGQEYIVRELIEVIRKKGGKI